MNELFNRLSVITATQRSMLATAKQEERALTDEETRVFDELTEEKRSLEREIEAQRAPEFTAPVMEERTAADFAEFACDETRRTLEMRSAQGPIKDDEKLAPKVFRGLLDAITEANVLHSLGVKLMNGEKGDPYFVYPGTVEASIEGEVTAVTDTTINFSEVKASPKRLAVSIPVSNRALYRSNIDLQNVVTVAIADGVSRTLNKALLSTKEYGTGATKLKGPFAETGVKKVEINKGTKPTFANLVQLEAEVLAQNWNINPDTTAYIINPKTLGDLKATPVEKGNPAMVVTATNGGYICNGYPVLVSGFVEEGKVLFGDFGALATVHFDSADLIKDPYTKSKENITNFVFNGDFDFLTLTPKAFAYLETKAQ